MKKNKRTIKEIEAENVLLRDEVKFLREALMKAREPTPVPFVFNPIQVPIYIPITTPVYPLNPPFYVGDLPLDITPNITYDCFPSPGSSVIKV